MKASSKKPRRELPDRIVNAVVILFAVLNIFPLYWLFTSSFKTSAGIFKMPPDWFPKDPSLNNYRELLGGQPMLQWAFNSLLVSVAATLLVVACSSMASYAFAKLEFPFKKSLFMLLISSLMIPKEIFIVPLFKIILKLNWSDSYLAMIFPNIATAFGVYLLYSFFQTVPDSIRESGKLDGANEMQVFLQLILPMVKPGVGALFILNFVNVWNDYLWQMLIARSREMMTLMVGTASLMQEINPNFAYKMAGASVAALPMLIIFLAFQRYFTGGLTMGAVKE